MNPASVAGTVRAYWNRQFPFDYVCDAGAPLPWNKMMLLAASLCPNIEELDLFFAYDDMVGLNEPVALTELNTITLAREDPQMGVELRELVPLVDLAPNLETLVARQVACETSSDQGLKLGNLRHLRLDNSDLGPALLHLLLGSRPRLESFDYRAIAPDRLLVDVYESHFIPMEAGEAIVTRVPDLRELRLDLNLADSPHDFITFPYLIRLLKYLVQLESLSLDTRCLLPHINPYLADTSPPPNEEEDLLVRDTMLVDLLPSYLRKIRIVGGSLGPDVVRLGSALSKLAHDAPGRFPSLATVEVSGKGAESVEARRSDYDSSGIEFFVFSGSGL